MTDRICTRCAKPFRGEPWRAGCSRCGGLVREATPANVVEAGRRADHDGWFIGGRRIDSHGHYRNPLYSDAKLWTTDLARKQFEELSNG